MMTPLEFQRFQIKDLLLLTQDKQVTVRYSNDKSIW